MIVNSNLQVTLHGAIRMPTTDAGSRESTDPLVEAVNQIGDRWSLLVIEALLRGPRRFGELLEQIGGLAPNILSRRLKQLERDRLVTSEPYSQRPRRYVYRLTAAGDELAGVVRLLTQWATARHAGSIDGPSAGGVAHQTCGTPLEAQWFCPTCGEVVEGDEAGDLYWV
jgi:DNA-binding HxlR family transcriptional regulator